jgi:hypothetical protein
MFRIRILAAVAAFAVLAACSEQTTAPTPAPAPGPGPSSGSDGKSTATQPSGAAGSAFSMSGLAFNFPIPAEFCAPDGQYVARAQALANGDTANHTSFTFMDCGSMQRGGDLLRWGMVKTPRNLVNTNVGSLPAVIAELKRQFDSGDFERQMNQGVAQAAGDQRFATTARPLGTDPYGAYVGGTLTVDNRTMAAAWGMTAIKGRLFAVYVYGPYNGDADVQDVITRAKAATRAFVDANPGG